MTSGVELELILRGEIWCWSLLELKGLIISVLHVNLVANKQDAVKLLTISGRIAVIRVINISEQLQWNKAKQTFWEILNSFGTYRLIVHYVMAAMLVVKNNKIFLLRDLTSIFMQTWWVNFLLIWHQHGGKAINLFHVIYIYAKSKEVVTPHVRPSINTHKSDGEFWQLFRKMEDSFF